MNKDPSRLWLMHYNTKNKQYNPQEIANWVQKKRPFSGAPSFLAKLDLINIHRDWKVLEIGCGTGKYGLAIAVKKGCKIVLSDYSYGVLTLAKNVLDVLNKKLMDVSLVQADIRQLSFKNHFDLVLSMGLIEHWQNRKDRISRIIEMMECVKPGGWIVNWVPNKANPFYKLWVRTEYPPLLETPEWPFDANEISELYQEVGLENVFVTGYMAYITPFIWPSIFSRLRFLSLLLWSIGRILPARITESLSLKFSHGIIAFGQKPC